MTEPKRRGRPPKAQAGDGHIAVIKAYLAESVRLELPKVDEPSVFTQRQAQAYANRVWAGQSPDVKRAERIERVKRALAGQNLPFEGVNLP